MALRTKSVGRGLERGASASAVMFLATLPADRRGLRGALANSTPQTPRTTAPERLLRGLVDRCHSHHREIATTSGRVETPGSPRCPSRSAQRPSLVEE